jgi:uncharacterized protein YbjQ (UPF0145 family)
MDIRWSRFCALLASTLLVLAGTALGQTAEPLAPQLRQYTFSELVADRYDIVSRLGGDMWRSAFSLPTFTTREQAVAALGDEAAARGANALLNVYCLDQGRGMWPSRSEKPAILCYAIAIRVKPG